MGESHHEQAQEKKTEKGDQHGGGMNVDQHEDHLIPLGDQANPEGSGDLF